MIVSFVPTEHGLLLAAFGTTSVVLFLSFSNASLFPFSEHLRLPFTTYLLFEL